jgi:hypothetical protein
MKVFGVAVMMMRNTLEVKQLVLLLLFVGHKRNSPRKGQRLPAYAKD